MKLTNELENFVMNWGEKLSHWGLNRTECQVFSVLFISPDPLSIEEITDLLSVARSNVSSSLKELMSWKIVRLVNISGDRRKHYEAMKDVWDLFRQVIHEQKRREIDPMVEVLNSTRDQLNDKKDISPTESYAMERLNDIDSFFEETIKWYKYLDNMNPRLLAKYANLAGTVEKWIKKV